MDQDGAFKVMDKIRYEGAERVWSAEKDFGGGEQSTPNPWSELAQALLQSNEILFVD